MLSLHKAFDIFVMSSVTEGLGTSLLDAMACGKPVVATTAGGIPEVVEDGVTGLLVPPRDHERDGRRHRPAAEGRGAARRMGAAGLARVRERFSAERMVQDTLRVYQRVVDATLSDQARSSTAASKLPLQPADSGIELSPDHRHHARPATRAVARAVVERDGGAVVGERHAARDARADGIAVRLDRFDLAGRRFARSAS